MEYKFESVNLLNPARWHLTPYQVLTLGFVGLILTGTLLLMLPAATANGQGLGFVDALFMATSAVCVTGLAVVDVGSYFSNAGHFVILLLIQVGGVGIMTMATLMALLMGKRIQLSERLVMQEALNQLTVAGVVRLTRYVIKVTLIIEFIGGSLLAAYWYTLYGVKGIYFGYWHAVSAFCNAGFVLFGNSQSLIAYQGNVMVQATMAVLIILGGIGFAVLADLLRHKQFSACSLHSKVVLVTSGLLIVVGTLVVLLLEYNNIATIGTLPLENQLLNSFFQAVTPRSAGFHSLDISSLREATLFFILILMFIGASPASTGGGIKTATLAVLAAAIWSLIRGKSDAELFRRRIPQNVVYKSFAVVLIAIAFIVVMTMLLSICEQAPFFSILFEVVSAFSTAGLSLGITDMFSSNGKLILTVTMFVGRLGPMTLALAFALRTKKSPIQYPEGKITIG